MAGAMLANIDRELILLYEKIHTSDRVRTLEVMCACASVHVEVYVRVHACTYVNARGCVNLTP